MIGISWRPARAGAPYHPIHNLRRECPHREYKAKHERRHNLATIVLNPAQNVRSDLFGRESRN